MDNEKTTDQDKKVPNPTGKGGFQERPQDRNQGTWKAENSQRFCLNKFLHMTEQEFLEWGKNNPPETRTVAQILAYERVTAARKELADYREVTDRTEGKPIQPIAQSVGLTMRDLVSIKNESNTNENTGEDSP